jgi:hypothetical protein
MKTARISNVPLAVRLYKTQGNYSISFIKVMSTFGELGTSLDRKRIFILIMIGTIE